MNEEENVVTDDSNTENEEVILDVETEEVAEETVEEIKARLAKAEELAHNYKIRAEKAESKSKEAPKVAPNDLSSKDTIALIRADVADEDIEEVVEYAKLKKISVTDALKTNIMKTILEQKREERTVASATNTGTARRSNTRVSDEVLLDKASKGTLPETEEDMARLFNARHKR